MPLRAAAVRKAGDLNPPRPSLFKGGGRSALCSSFASLGKGGRRDSAGRVHAMAHQATIVLREKALNPPHPSLSKGGGRSALCSSFTSLVKGGRIAKRSGRVSAMAHRVAAVRKAGDLNPPRPSLFKGGRPPFAPSRSSLSIFAPSRGGLSVFAHSRGGRIIPASRISGLYGQNRWTPHKGSIQTQSPRGYFPEKTET